MKEITITTKNLISSILLLIIGILLLTSSDDLINILSWGLGAILIIIGIVKIFTYYRNKKQQVEISSTDVVFGVLLISMGLVLILMPEIIDITIRLIFGGWILITGINRLILSLTVKSNDSSGFKLYLISSILMILLGILVLLNFYGIIGIYLIIYSISDIVGYIYSTTMKSKIEVKTTKKSSNKKDQKIKKSVKEKKAIDAEVVE